MAANTLPIYPKTPNVSWTTLTTANTSRDGTGDVAILYTAGPDGSRISKIMIKHLGTNAQTVLRIFINNGNSTTNPGNNTFYVERTVMTATASDNSATAYDEIELDIAIPGGYRLLATLGSAVASGLAITAVGGDY